MNSRFPIVVISATLGAGVLLSACGSDNSSDNPTVSPQPLQSAPAKKPGSGGVIAVKPPVSADDERPAAPDDAVSDRPGGPNKKNKKKNPAQGSGGISPG